MGRGKIVPVHNTKTTEGVEVQFHLFLILALDGHDWSKSRPGRTPVPIQIQSRSGRYREEKNSFPCRDSNLQSSSPQSIRYPEYCLGEGGEAKICFTIPDYPFYVSNQRDALLSSLFVVLQDHSTCFGCPLHPSSGVHKTESQPLGQVMYIGDIEVHF